MISEFIKWFLIFIACSFGSIVLYYVCWHTFATLAPSTYEKIALKKVNKSIRFYFGFLFNEGYKIQDAHYSYKAFGNWSVQLESENCAIIITKDRSEIFLSFSSRKWDRNTHIGLRPMIYYLSGCKRLFGFFDGDIHRDEDGQYKWLAGLLREYLDQITPYFGDNYESIKNELVSIQNRYNDILMTNGYRGERIY